RLVRRARVAALPPGVGRSQLALGGEGDARDAAQEVDLVLLRALLVFGAFHEVLQPLGIARVARALVDAAFVGGVLVSVDRLADLAQRAAQVLLLGALR